MGVTTLPLSIGTPRAEAVIDLAAIRANVGTLREHARGAAVLAVVKADGYGHGIVESARAAVDGGAEWLGVSFVEEGLALRATGLRTPAGDRPRVLSWLAAPGERFGEAIAADIDVAAYATWQLSEIAEAAAAAGSTARVHLKVDTGLGRGGALVGDAWAALVDAALAAEADGTVRVIGVWSHLARADEPGDPSIKAQVTAFDGAVAFAERVGLRPEVRHLANSAAVLTAAEDTAYDLVRTGLSVYGLSPVPQVGPPEWFGLTPAMTLRARVALVKRVAAGQGVSYGHRYVTTAPTSLGLIPLGYADGLPRSASDRGPVLIGGRRQRVAGTVCMDQFVVDLGDQPVREGDECVLFGSGVDGEPTVQDWAAAAGTIPYEIVTGIGSRVKRTYRGLVTDPGSEVPE